MELLSHNWFCCCLGISLGTLEQDDNLFPAAVGCPGSLWTGGSLLGWLTRRWVTPGLGAASAAGVACSSLVGSVIAIGRRLLATAFRW